MNLCKLEEKLRVRKEADTFRELTRPLVGVDFFSNDYLGFAADDTIDRRVAELLRESGLKAHGATGSRLLSGNHPLYARVEGQVASFHQTPTALLFNSGYDANVGFFSSVPQRGDVILYDEWVHASIRDGIRLSPAQAFKFRHNDAEHLSQLLKRLKPEHSASACCYVATESVFSMDGDCANLDELAALCKAYGARLVVDEAHALGVFGEQGRGLAHGQEAVFARIVTFGKALGCHGAAVLGSELLKDYLVNFARSLIYTTALPPVSLATVMAAYESLAKTENIKRLHDRIVFFKEKRNHLGLDPFFLPSDSAIQSLRLSGDTPVKLLEEHLHQKGFVLKAIRPPTVPPGTDRIRICLHSFNTEAAIEALLTEISEYLRTRKDDTARDG